MAILLLGLRAGIDRAAAMMAVLHRTQTRDWGVGTVALRPHGLWSLLRCPGRSNRSIAPCYPSGELRTMSIVRMQDQFGVKSNTNPKVCVE